MVHPATATKSLHRASASREVLRYCVFFRFYFSLGEFASVLAPCGAWHKKKQKILYFMYIRRPRCVNTKDTWLCYPRN